LGATPAALCHLAWGLVLARGCAQEDVVFGTVLFGRMQGGAGVERALGLFINTLPLRLSIDIRVQRELREAVEAQRALHNALGGAAVMMDIRNGEIIGMVSNPDFIASDLTSASATSMFNRVTTGVYEPGSTFKLFTTAMALELGASFDDARRALGRFGGVARRFELRGRLDDVTFVDDYAHLPAEIAAVLAAAASSGDDWKRIIAVFQPNRYSRMEQLWPEYRDAFIDADVVVLTDIYGSGEQPRPGVTGKLVVNAVLDAHPSTRVVYLPSRSDLVSTVARMVRPGDVCISMGCGDIASFPSEVLERRAELAVRRG
jgi:hypothetical protein